MTYMSLLKILTTNNYLSYINLSSKLCINYLKEKEKAFFFIMGNFDIVSNPEILTFRVHLFIFIPNYISNMLVISTI